MDGTKIKANASKHKGLSWDYANKLEEQLKGEVEELMRPAEETDQSVVPEEMDIPEELKRVWRRLNKPREKSRRGRAFIASKRNMNRKPKYREAVIRGKSNDEL